MNEAIDPEKSGFLGMLTLINLCEDSLSETRIHIPQEWRGAEAICTLGQDGAWRPAAWEKQEGTLLVREKLPYLEPLYLLVK